MDWNELCEKLILDTVPDEIYYDKQRLNDYLAGAEDLFKLLNQLSEDDLK